jgi:peptide/nickel transport system ATP-binding protein
LQVRGLRIDRIREGRREKIVAGVDLSVAPGETIGIVGESGSGKSMTARAIIGLLPLTLVASGEVEYEGRNLLGMKERQLRAVRGREIGMIMQDPFTMLNPVIRCGTILDESLRSDVRGSLSRSERRSEAVRRLAEVGIEDGSVVDRFPFQLSGGMRQRLAIAATLAREPRVLIADEPSTALDVTTQRDVLALIKALQVSRGMGMILITHDLRVAFAMCDRIYVLYAGSLVEVGPASTLEAEPLHPYTHGLLLSEPPADSRVEELTSIPGSVPAPDDVSESCTFAQRCRWAERVCRERAPPLVAVDPGRQTSCIRIAEIRAEMSVLRGHAERQGLPPDPQRPSRALIDVVNAHKVFRNGSRQVTALDGVSLQVGENESVGLVGESGSGKTTLARILVGLELPTAGAFTIAGVDASNWSKLSPRDRRKLRGAVQIIFQDPYSSLNPMRTVGSTLREAIVTHDAFAQNLGDRVKDLLNSVGLPPSYAGRKPVALSGGERQRVAIARALAVKPRVLICDEPVSALDVSVQAQILNLFAHIRQERGIGYLFITHDLSIVRQVTEHVYVMHRGRIVESGPVEDVLSQPKDDYTIRLMESVPRSESGWLSSTGRLS